MTKQEALALAQESHVLVETLHEPANGYRTEYVCSCGEHVTWPFARHVGDEAADLLAEAA
jgi:hypothetical protein